MSKRKKKLPAPKVAGGASSKRGKKRPASASSISVYAAVRRVLQRGSRQGAEYVPGETRWPNFSAYAGWCGCSHTTISKFANGRTERLNPLLFNRLAYLTGVYPTAKRSERRHRLADAERWRQSKELQQKYPEILDYLAERHSDRRNLGSDLAADHPGTQDDFARAPRRKKKTRGNAGGNTGGASRLIVTESDAPFDPNIASAAKKGSAPKQGQSVQRVVPRGSSKSKPAGETLSSPTPKTGGSTKKRVRKVKRKIKRVRRA